MFKFSFLIFIFIFWYLPIKSVHAFSSCEAEIIQASKTYAIPINILYSVAAQESKRGEFLNPLALNIRGVSISPDNLDSALNLIQKNIQSGNLMIDIGCMQINYYYHHESFRSIITFFNPHDNVDYAAKYLKSLYLKFDNWTMAVARYNAGASNTLAQKKYVCAVISMMSLQKLGKKTSRVEDFCNG